MRCNPSVQAGVCLPGWGTMTRCVVFVGGCWVWVLSFGNSITLLFKKTPESGLWGKTPRSRASRFTKEKGGRKNLQALVGSSFDEVANKSQQWWGSRRLGRGTNLAPRPYPAAARVP
jgi:hypothetical protein